MAGSLAQQVSDRSRMKSFAAPNEEEWIAATLHFPIGRIVETVVFMCVPFGVFVSLDDTSVKGLFRLTDLDPAGTPVPPGSEGVPVVGSIVEGIVIGHGQQKQIVLSRRFDHYDAFSGDDDE
jgi:ribosomal protein S1